MMKEKMIDYQFKLNLVVRDYECDLQGIVNNAIYQHYLEHARHVYLKQAGIDFIALTKMGINLVVVRVEIDYLNSLRGGDQFVVGLDYERISRMRFGFFQGIYRLPDNKSIAKAKTICSSANEVGRPILPREVEKLMDDLLQSRESPQTKG